MPFAEDLAPFFNPADFATGVTVAGMPINAIFDNAYIDALDVAGTRPRLLCRSVDVAAVVAGAAAVVNGVSYLVRGIEPDGTGVSTLVLERQ